VPRDAVAHAEANRPHFPATNDATYEVTRGFVEKEQGRALAFEKHLRFLEDQLEDIVELFARTECCANLPQCLRNSRLTP
jgi:hypothetical protein